MADDSDKTLEEVERLAEYMNIARIASESPIALAALTRAQWRIAALEKLVSCLEHERLVWLKWNLKQRANIEAGEWYAAFQAEMYPVRSKWRKVRARIGKVISG